jgi:hypothetical protein
VDRARLGEVLTELRNKRRHFHDPLMLFGILWAALTLFSILQGIADFDLGRYAGIVLK